jgi:heptaprenyl diphosphate synthase
MPVTLREDRPVAPHSTPSSSRRVARFGVLLAVALVLHGIERFIPVPVPFLRPGLANVATVIMLVTSGTGDALVLTVLRVTLASLIVGTFAGPGFAMAMAGGLASTLAMGLARRVAFPSLGVVGLSLIGAAVHNIAQLAVVAGLFTGVAAASMMLPAALLLAAVTGLVTGLVALFALEKLPFRGHNGRVAPTSIQRSREVTE